MKQSVSVLLMLLLLSVSVGFPVLTQEATEIDINLTDACVSDFDENVDYFPNKVDIEFAENFSVEYFNHYKLVSVTTSLDEIVTYALVQCGTPVPEDLGDETIVIEVPTGRIITLSTTQTVHLAELDLLDQLVGMDSFLFISSPEVRELIDDDLLVEVSPNFEINLEVVLDAEPAVVMTDDFDPERLTALNDVDITAVLNTEYLESSPLGRAEWIKYVALLYNVEATANDRFDALVADYMDIRDLVADIAVEDRPTVLWNAISQFSDTWGIPGAETFAGQFINDAGGVIAMSSETDPEYVAYVSLETVYEAALDADIWITNLFNVPSIEGLIAIDARYEDFGAVQNGNVWNNDLDVNANGGNNYYELGVVNPALVLRDLVAIFHPELLPDHDFAFHRPMTSED